MSPADAIETLLCELERLIRSAVVEGMQTAPAGWVHQKGSLLGNRKHIAAVRRRLRQGDGGASHPKDRDFLLSPEAYAEELQRPPKGKVTKTQAYSGRETPSTIRAELEQELRLVRGVK